MDSATHVQTQALADCGTDTCPQLCMLAHAHRHVCTYKHTLTRTHRTYTWADKHMCTQVGKGVYTPVDSKAGTDS